MPLDFVPLDRLDGPSTAFLVHGVTGLLLAAHLAFAIHRLLSHRRAAAAAQAAEARQPPLAPGRASLCGVVETDDERPAITLTLWEEGKEWAHKGQWRHRWKERSRSLEVRPFTLRLPDGQRVRVIPDQRVIYMDSMRIRLFTGEERSRSADLEAGERVRADGVLLWSRPTQAKGVYRGGEEASFVMRAGRATPLLVAVGGLRAAHARWARWYGRAALALGLCFAALHGAAYGRYHLLRAAGEVVEASVVRERTTTSFTRRRTITRYYIDARAEGPGGQSRSISDEVSLETYLASRGGRLRVVPALVVPWAPSIHCIGTKAPLPTFWGPAGQVLGIVAMTLFWWLRAAATPWYEQRRVVERGSGSLAQSVQRYEEEEAKEVAGG